MHNQPGYLVAASLIEGDCGLAQPTLRETGIMTSLVQDRMNLILALAIPVAGFVYLTFGAFLTLTTTVAITLALGGVWLAAVVTVNTIREDRGDFVDRSTRDVGENLIARRAATPPSVVDVSRPPVKRWRWTSVLLAPVELLALAWSVPVIILLIMVPIGLALAGALWVGRFLIARF